MKYNTNITSSELKARLDYDPNTGIFRWIAKPATSQANKNWNTKFAGKVAGTLITGYISISIDKRHFLAHRLAYLYMTGEWPNEIVDHRNLIRSDNRWCNIRPATFADNVHNQGLTSRNTSGFKGVSWHEGCGKWLAQIGNGKRCRHLGLFDDIKDAAAAYDNAAKKRDGEFSYVAPEPSPVAEWTPMARSRSGVRGVSWNATKNRWQARATIDGKAVWLGLHDTIEAAQAAKIKSSP